MALFVKQHYANYPKDSPLYMETETGIENGIN